MTMGIVAQLESQFAAQQAPGAVGLPPVMAAEMQLKAGIWQAALNTLQSNYDAGTAYVAWIELLSDPANGWAVQRMDGRWYPSSIPGYGPAVQPAGQVFGQLLSPVLAPVFSPTLSVRPAGQAYPANSFSQLLALAGTGLGAYHGYKRDDSIGWAIWWGLLGGLFPVITTVVAVAQGYGKPAKG